MRNTILFTLCCSLAILLAPQEGFSQSKKFLKKLRGDWQLDGMIQYDDTVFSVSTMDSTKFIVDFIQKNKAIRELEVLSEKDSLMMAGIIKKRLTNLTATRIIFEKDSVYKSLTEDEKNNSFGKYWSTDDNSVYIKDLRSGAIQLWEIELSKEYIRMENTDERMVFILRKN